MLTNACLANRDAQALIAERREPYSESGLRRHPIVRIDFEEGFAIASIGEELAATRCKHWADGPSILPLEPDDPVDSRRILYVFKKNSRYKRRFDQRKRLTQLLGQANRTPEERAKRSTTSELTGEETKAIWRALEVSAGTLWRAARVKMFIDLPSGMVRRSLPFDDNV